MKRSFSLMMAGASALLIGTGAVTASALAADSVATSVPVESAGKDGGRGLRTAQVESADYDGALRPQKAPPATATPIPLLAVLGAGVLASGLALRMRRRSRSRAVHAEV